MPNLIQEAVQADCAMSRGETLKSAAACRFAGYQLPAAGRSGDGLDKPMDANLMTAQTSAPRRRSIVPVSNDSNQSA